MDLVLYEVTLRAVLPAVLSLGIRPFLFPSVSCLWQKYLGVLRCCGVGAYQPGAVCEGRSAVRAPMFSSFQLRRVKVSAPSSPHPLCSGMPWPSSQRVSSARCFEPWTKTYVYQMLLPVLLVSFGLICVFFPAVLSLKTCSYHSSPCKKKKNNCLVSVSHEYWPFFRWNQSHIGLLCQTFFGSGW